MVAMGSCMESQISSINQSIKTHVLFFLLFSGLWVGSKFELLYCMPKSSKTRHVCCKMKLRSSMKMKMKMYWRMVFFCCFCVGISYAQNSQLTAGQILRDYEQLVSPNGNFQLLFFSPAGTSKRYLGIQHNGWSPIIPTAGYLWVANRENPVLDTSGVLNITQEGNVVLSDSRGPFITVNSNQKPAAAAAANNTTVTTTLSLHDSGNLILKAAGDQIVWQSFDYPSHTLLPGMKLGIFGLKTGSPPQNKFLTSWISPMVAAAGAFTLGINPNNTRELVIWRRDVLYRRIGIWNGTIFTHIIPVDSDFNFSYHSNENESYYTISRLNPIRISSDNGVWMTINPTGSFDMYAHPNNYLLSIETCDDDNKRGEFYQGCVRPEPSNCKMGDDFSQKSGQYYLIEGQFSDYQHYNLSISDCKEICKKNCSCTSYLSARDDGTGCTFPSAQETSIFSNGTYYSRNRHKDRPRKKRLSWLIISGPVVVSLLLVLSLLLGYLGMRRKKRSSSQGDTELIMNELNASMAKVDKLSGAHKVDLRGKKDHELPIFKFSSIQVATDHFSDANKLGQGGFGPVYKGKLVDGQEIAVKRLAKRSGQGLEEFKNEVMLISKLQHRNLVRVLGCCMQGEERILIYEYLPNKSLDYFLFDATKRALLDWKKRVCIIEGIAQGLLYLHMYSRFKIIHRDLKTSNILLDSNMNPKISDFGTARIFGEDESLANTNRIVGTRGYMSPEYAMDGIFSVKSDVFSFGVMMLEIVCGMKNSGFYESDRHLNLLDYAWDLWKEGRCMELMNRELLDEICSTDDVMRYIQVGLLCVQESAADRPTMSDVLPMLSNKLMSLPAPKQPAFSAISGIDHNADLPQNPTPCSINDVTLSKLVAR